MDVHSKGQRGGANSVLCGPTLLGSLSGRGKGPASVSVCGAEQLPPGVVVASVDGIIRSVNDAVCRTFGHAREELVGFSINQLMPPAVAAQHDGFLKRYFEAGSFKTAATRVVVALTKAGMAIKVRLALSYMTSETTPLISALIDEVVERTFSLTANCDGCIMSVEAGSAATCGYSPSQLIGANVSVLCPPSMAHAVCMGNYRGPLKPTVVGHVLNRAMRHRLGHMLPISLEIHELTCDPVVFSVQVTEIEQSLEAMVTTDAQGTIVSDDSSCASMFGYEHWDTVGTSICLGDMPLRNGSVRAMCHHKDGSHFFVTVDVQPFANADGDLRFCGVVLKAMPNGTTRQGSAMHVTAVAPTNRTLDWYELTDKSLGDGLFGAVKVATHRLSGVSVAVKTLKKKQCADEGLLYPPRELELLKKLHHPHIVRLLHSVVTARATFLIMEMVTGGELFAFAAAQDGLSEDVCRGLMRQIVSAVDYMHRSGVVHRDLKLENILLDKHGQVKIIDLGFSALYDRTGAGTLSTSCGSVDYAAPELWERKPYFGPKVDVWSLGVILFVLSTGCVPFNDSTQIVQLLYDWPPSVTISCALKDFIHHIFCPAKARTTMDEIIAHPWLNDQGRLKPVSRQSISCPPAMLNESVLARMETLGLPRASVEKAVLEMEHNQLSATYLLLDLQLEEARHGPSDRGCETSQVKSTSDPPSPSPARGLSRDSTRNSQKKCTIT